VDESNLERSRFVPFDKLMAYAPPEADWLWEGFLAEGSVTLLAGQPKVGKSTFTFALLAALGRAVGPVISIAVAGEGLTESGDSRSLAGAAA
jgi:hypothetical protein